LFSEIDDTAINNPIWSYLMFKKMFSVCLVLCLGVGAGLTRADDQQVVATARKTLQTYDKAIITLAAVIKIEAKGMDIPSLSNQEHKTQCVAAIIDRSGLVLTSLTNLSPKIKLNRGGGQSLELECQVQEVKYRLTDGTEVLARIVLKDEDLDLAFLAPLKPLDKATEAKIAVLPMGEAVAQAEMLDTTIFIGRTGEDLNYIPTLSLGRIVSIVSTPRTCYISSSGGLGVPVFNHEGKAIGIICRCVKAEGGEGSSLNRSSTLINQLILPAADIVKLVPQAKEEIKKAAEAEKKAAETKKKKPKAGGKKAAGEKKAAEPKKNPVAGEKKPAEPKKEKPADTEKAAHGTVN
jgi:hypothetical protein